MLVCPHCGVLVEADKEYTRHGVTINPRHQTVTLPDGTSHKISYSMACLLQLLFKVETPVPLSRIHSLLFADREVEEQVQMCAIRVYVYRLRKILKGYLTIRNIFNSGYVLEKV